LKKCKTIGITDIPGKAKVSLQGELPT